MNKVKLLIRVSQEGNKYFVPKIYSIDLMYEDKIEITNLRDQISVRRPPSDECGDYFDGSEIKELE